MDLGLADKAYIVTGASRGLGLACARTLLDEAAAVVLSSRREADARKVVEQLSAEDPAVEKRLASCEADLGDPTAARRLVEEALARFGRLDGALISVGGPPFGSGMNVTDEDWRASFETVFLGALRVARAAAESCRPAGGSILFILSTSVRQPIPGLAISNGLRPGLAMMAKTLADELGEQGIRVNGVMPGRIETDRLRAGAAGGDDDAVRPPPPYVPLGRNGTPEEFARAAVFLLSPAASYITGAVVPVDGGMTRTL